jgi:transcription elongation factor S-II
MQSNESEDVGERRDSSDDKRRDSFTDDSGLPLSPTAGLPSVEVDDTKDPTRIKCRDMLSAALRTQPTVEGGGDCDILAAEIEHFVYKQFDNTDMKYKNRIRSRITNLKDTKNPRLRENVLLGHISPKHFSMMSPDEMASDEMKKLREKLSAEAFNDHQMSTNSGTKSDLFKCGRCGKRNTTYNQLQTRSSDEPMTTFVFCNECGYRWKFC